MRIPQLTVFLFALHCGLFSGTYGQTSDEKLINISWSGVYFSDQSPALFIITGGKETQISIPSFSLSEPVQYRGKNPMIVYKKMPRVGSPDVLEPVGEISFDATWAKALLLFYPKPEGTNGMHAIRDESDASARWNLRIINVTTANIGLKVNIENTVIQYGESKTFSMPAEMKQVALRYALKMSDEWKWMGSNFFRITPKGRTTVILASSGANFFKSTGASGEAYDGGSLQVFSFEQNSPRE